MHENNLIQVTRDTLQACHICCAISSLPEAKACAGAKKAWMDSVFDDGYQFTRLNENGKVFIETIPAQNAWAPICAKNWLFIDCFWVSGKFKGQGLAGQLLQTALKRAKKEGFSGLCAVSSNTKRPFLSDPGFYRHKGFVLADTAPPFYQLLALPLVPGAALPQFTCSAKTGTVPQAGVCIWYSHHCPHPSKYLPLLAAVVQKSGTPFTAVNVADKATAQLAPNPFPTWAMFYNGQFVTNEIFSEAKMEKFLLNA